MPPAVTVIVNPAAGRGRPAWREPVERLLASLGRVEVVTPASPAATTDAARDAEARGVPLIVAAGGDGTVHRVVAGLHSSATRLGIVPVGAGNDLAGALGLPASPIDAAHVIVAGATRHIDVIDVNGRRVVSAAVFCAIADAAHLANTLKQAMPWLGPNAYRLAAARLILARGSDPVAGVIVANVPRLGGDLRLPSGSQPDDGLCEVATLRGGSRVTLARVLLALTLRRAPPEHALQWQAHRHTTLTFDDVVSASGDGEDLGSARSFRIDVVRGVLRMVVGALPNASAGYGRG
jgi:diacylglycerol kinase (ATP)